MQCPYQYYAALRSIPPHRLPSGDYVISRRADILEVTRQPETFSNHHSAYDDGWMRAATLSDHANPDYAWGIAVSDPARPHLEAPARAIAIMPRRIEREQCGHIRPATRGDLLEAAVELAEKTVPQTCPNSFENVSMSRTMGVIRS